MTTARAPGSRPREALGAVSRALLRHDEYLMSDAGN